MISDTSRPTIAKWPKVNTYMKITLSWKQMSSFAPTFFGKPVAYQEHYASQSSTSWRHSLLFCIPHCYRRTIISTMSNSSTDVISKGFFHWWIEVHLTEPWFTVSRRNRHDFQKRNQFLLLSTNHIWLSLPTMTPSLLLDNHNQEPSQLLLHC